MATTLTVLQLGLAVLGHRLGVGLFRGGVFVLWGGWLVHVHVCRYVCRLCYQIVERVVRVVGGVFWVVSACEYM